MTRGGALLDENGALSAAAFESAMRDQVRASAGRKPGCRSVFAGQGLDRI